MNFIFWTIYMIVIDLILLKVFNLIVWDWIWVLMSMIIFGGVVILLVAINFINNLVISNSVNNIVNNTLNIN